MLDQCWVNIISFIIIILEKVNLEKRDILKFQKEFIKNLDERLAVSKYLAGNKYTIADIATFPWIARHEWHDIGLKKF